jgi:hypothetical protein
MQAKMQANETSKNFKEGRLPMNSYRLEQALGNCDYQISIRTDGSIGKECLSIKTVKTPHEEYGWPNGGDIIIPLPLYPKFKEALIQWEAAMGTVDGEGAGDIGQWRVDK